MVRKKTITLLKSEKGFTMSELLIAVLIFSMTFAGLLMTCLRSIELSELTANYSAAMNSVLNVMADIENTPFNQITAAYDKVSFNDASLTGKGVSYVNPINANELEVTIYFSWMEKKGRVIGDDVNLNGQIDGDEDTDGDQMLNSPVMVKTRIFNS